MSLVEFQHKSLGFEVSVFMKLELYMYFLKLLWNRTLVSTKMKAKDQCFSDVVGKVCIKASVFHTLINPWGSWLAMENGTHLLSPSVVCPLLTIHYLRTPLPAKTDTPLSSPLPPLLRVWRIRRVQRPLLTISSVLVVLCPSGTAFLLSSRPVEAATLWTSQYGCPTAPKSQHVPNWTPHL